MKRQSTFKMKGDKLLQAMDATSDGSDPTDYFPLLQFLLITRSTEPPIWAGGPVGSRGDTRALRQNKSAPLSSLRTANPWFIASHLGSPFSARHKGCKTDFSIAYLNLLLVIIFGAKSVPNLEIDFFYPDTYQ